jgi:hypothetical protein
MSAGRVLALLVGLGPLFADQSVGQVSRPGVTHLDAQEVVVSVFPDSLDGVHLDAKIRHKRKWVFFRARFDPATVVAWLEGVERLIGPQSPVLAGLGGRCGVVLVMGDKGRRNWVLQTLDKKEPLSIQADRQFNDTLLVALRAAAELSAMDSAAFASGLAAPVEEQPDSLDPSVIHIPTPEYPARLASSGIRGLVLVRYIVGADGGTEMGSIEPLWASDPEFILPVEHALGQGRFRPARLNGQPVRRRVYQSIYFRQYGMRDGWN